MRIKAAFLIGGAVGYVLGTRAGREQFEKIRSSAQGLWEDPRVQDTVSGVEERAAGFVRDVAPELKEKVTGAVRSATEAVRPSKGDPELEEWSGNPSDSPETGSARPNGTTTDIPRSGTSQY